MRSAGRSIPSRRSGMILPAIMSSITDPSAWVDSAARNQPARLFLKTPSGRQYDYASLREHSGRFAAALTLRGVVPGDRVAVQVDKSPDAVFLYVACVRAGAVFVPINTANTPNEVEYFLRDSRPRVAVFRPGDRVLLEPLARNAEIPHIETLGADGSGSLPDLAARVTPDPAQLRVVATDALAAIVYTSGTTG